MTSGLSGVSVLLAVYFKNYTDASQGEIGVLLMTFPFVGLIVKPLFCSMADRKQAHKRYMILSLLIEFIGYAPFALIPFFPQFYTNHPRLAWYLLVVACHAGNGGLGVAWSLGDCLAMNMAQKIGTQFGNYRLMGTVSWGLYGFIIGQINEIWFLPKYVPAFLILLVSLIAELALIICWRNEDFEMVDTLQQSSEIIETTTDKMNKTNDLSKLTNATITTNSKVNINDLEQRPTNSSIVATLVDSTPSSLSGTLRLNAKAAGAIKEVLSVSSNSEDLQNKLHSVAQRQQQQQDIEKFSQNENKNPQIILLKMILLADGRVIKYIILFTVYGFLMAPMNFVFLSMESVCLQNGYNFSQLAGGVLISQATIETIAFLLVPTMLIYVTRSISLAIGFLLMAARFFFYADWYYTAGISPYWALLGEWGHGISYGIFCIILADVSLMIANQSRLFIPELRRLGYLSDEKTSSREKIEAEERSVKMALRATMQALFGGFMDGLGNGTGALICGIFIEIYSYISLWQMYWMVALSAFILHQIIEVTRSRWSDTYKPAKGTKAYEIMQLTSGNQEEKAGLDKSALGSNQEKSPPPFAASC